MIFPFQHDDVIKWKHFPRAGHLCGEFTGVPAQRPVTRTLVFSLICAWINGWVNNGEAGDLRRHRAHYDVTVMSEGNPKPPLEFIVAWWGHLGRDRSWIKPHKSPFRDNLFVENPWVKSRLSVMSTPSCSGEMYIVYQSYKWRVQRNTCIECGFTCFTGYPRCRPW